MSLMSDGHVIMLARAHCCRGRGRDVARSWRARSLDVLRLAARPVIGAWQTVVAVVRGAVGTMIISDPRPRLCGDLRRTVCGLLWAAGAVSRRGPPALCCVR
jgi:hypothetical protein